jgi:predicted transcriptional regulator
MARRSKTPPPLHELEAEVMDVVWEHGEVSIRDVMEELNARTRRDRAYTTFLTAMHRLHGKGMLRRHREKKTDLYVPAYSREEYAELRAEAGVAALVDEYGDAALAQFARRVADLDPARRRALQRLARRD